MSLVFSIAIQAIQIYSYALIVYILMSWFPNARESSIGQFLGRICEPYLEVFRRFIPPLAMIDFSPIVGFLVLNLASAGIRQLYIWLAF